MPNVHTGTCQFTGNQIDTAMHLCHDTRTMKELKLHKKKKKELARACNNMHQQNGWPGVKRNDKTKRILNLWVGIPQMEQCMMTHDIAVNHVLPQRAWGMERMIKYMLLYCYSAIGPRWKDNMI